MPESDNINMFSRVEKPGRYIGGEFNSVIKNPGDVKVSFALAFPDVYEVGMSYLGFKILYHILNKMEFVQAERVYAPWRDMEDVIRSSGERLVSLETARALADFDLVGFTLQYELTYSNILNMLNLGGIDIFAAKRDLYSPFVVGGGPCVYNPEPLSDFFDFFLVGEGEELIGEIAAACRDWKKAGRPGGRRGFLLRAAALPGVYVPGFYQADYADGHFAGMTKNEPDAPLYVNKRVLRSLDLADYPTAPVVPFTEIVHDRVILELFRGCTRGCRFCHAGMVYRPVRERGRDTLAALAKDALDNTGYNEISLMSLSSADYSCLPSLLDTLLSFAQKERVSVSLPSLRTDSFSVDLANKVRQIRKSGLTFAPEAGTQRLRDVINKGVTEDDLLTAAGAAFSSGWTLLKLYFMIGLPTETFEDIDGIARLAEKVLAAGRTVRRDARLTVSVASFVPKPWTPFQWAAQDSSDTLRQKQLYLKSLIKNKAIAFQYHDPAASALEGLFARGGRPLGEILFTAWQQGARFDGWSDCFKPSLWQEALSRHDYKEEEYKGVFPWEHIRPGVSREYLWSEWQKAARGCLTADCRAGCTGCGVCPALGVDVAEAAR